MAQKKKKDAKSEKTRKDSKRRVKKIPAKKEEFVEIENPYRPYDLVSGNFPHYDNVIKQIKKIFENHPGNRIVLLQGTIGPGKTSVLKRFENSPGIIGENYIPIYLDSKKYNVLNVDDLFFAVSRDIIEKMNQFGFRIPKPGYIKERRIKGRTFESYILTIECFLNSESIMVLMFDEFDNLLEESNVKVISEIIQHLTNVEKSWSNYALIFAGDRRLISYSKDDTIKRLLESGFNINIEGAFAEDNIKKLIIEPTKKQLTYDDGAIQRIMWYSGKDPYFQQLICYHLVNDLNEKHKNLCLLGDVDEAIQRILNDSKSNRNHEFVYTWENKISFEARLIVSALADESVTEKKGNLYFLKEGTLLEDIFGKEIYEQIDELQNFGYFNKMIGRRFSEFPFTIPLYGMWIQKEHPFLKTIIENIEHIADKIELNRFIEILKETPGDKLVPFGKESFLEIAKKWCSMKQLIMKKQDFSDKISAENIFIYSLSRILNLDIKKESQPSLNCYVINIKNLNIGILDEAFCFIQDKPELTTLDISSIERIAAGFSQENQTKLTLFIHFHRSTMVEDLVKKTYLNLIAIEENDLKKIMLSNNPEEAFRKFILSRLSLEKVSPYQIAGPTKTIFYGRSDIINQISRSTKSSYAIVGGRKIGKSSLLHKIKDNPPPNTIYIFMDLETEFSNVKSYKAFLKNLEFEIERVFYRRVKFRRFPFRKDISKLPEIFRKLSTANKRIVFILDEIDNLIKFDRKKEYKLMRIFRSMSEKGYCQFIFAGFKELYHAKRNIENPLYNFSEEIMLEPLDRESALDLITKPMESIGVKYNTPEDREFILEHTARHPNLLQFFCKHLIKKIEKHDIDKRRTIFIEDIEELLNIEYEKYIMDEVYMFFSDLTPINRLILILLVEQPFKKSHLSIHEIRELLIEKGIQISIENVYKNLSNLVMRFILLEEGREYYKFALSVFPEILRKRIDRYFRNTIIEEVKINALQSL